jgi:hypothetical protein
MSVAVKGGNLRDMVVTTETGTDVKNTKMLSGEASPSAGWTAKNTLKEHTVSGCPKGDLGGMNKAK